MARFTLALLALCCLAALVSAASHDNEHRGRRGGVAHTHYRRRPVSNHGSHAARSRHVPTYSAPLTQEDKPEEEEPVQDEEAAQEQQEEEPAQEQQEDPEQQEQEEEQEEDEAVEEEPTPAPVKAHKPAHRGRGRPQHPSAAPAQEGNNGGATAIATAYSKGNNAQANSHAAAYGGHFKGGNFGQRHH